MNLDAHIAVTAKDSMGHQVTETISGMVLFLLKKQH
jgi:hypothetical protein